MDWDYFCLPIVLLVCVLWKCGAADEVLECVLLKPLNRWVEAGETRPPTTTFAAQPLLAQPLLQQPPTSQSFSPQAPQPSFGGDSWLQTLTGVLSQTQKDGFLIMGGVRRWFELRSGVLSFFSDRDGDLQGNISLSGAIVLVVDDETTIGRHCFDISTPGLLKYRLEASTKPLRDSWLQTLTGGVSQTESQGVGTRSIDLQKPGLHASTYGEVRAAAGCEADGLPGYVPQQQLRNMHQAQPQGPATIITGPVTIVKPAPEGADSLAEILKS